MPKIIELVIYFFLRLLYATCRFQYFGCEYQQKAAAGKSRTYAIAFFHETIVASVIAHRGQTFCPLISSSKDGEIAARVAKRWGFFPIRGSSSRGGLKAIKSILDVLKRGCPVAIAIDGPRGPRRHCKSGIVNVAQKTQVPILPLFVLNTKQWVFERSWDKFKLPHPFSKILVLYGEPINVSETLTKEEFFQVQKNIENSINILEKKALTYI